MRGPAMRWISRARPCSPIFRPEHRQIPLLWEVRTRTPTQQPWDLTPALTVPPLKRSISSQPQSHLSPTAPKPSKSRTWTFFALGSVAVAGGLVVVAAALLTNQSSSISGNDRAALNKSTFVPFAITSKEQVSPSAFILNVRPSSPNGAVTPSSSAARIASAWQHGLWSVEIKQPQLQIARHYTPLPPPPPLRLPASSTDREGSKETEEEEEGGRREGELRFLIRRMDGGEMSTYLSKRAVGDVIWLRGPHLGFDIAWRLGSGSDSGDGGGHVVFLAGGTGIAPALQIARRLLDSSDNDHDNLPTLTILWANRLSADALGRPGPTPESHKPNLRIPFWSTPAHHSSPLPPFSPPSSSLARQIQALQQRHPGHFRISYYIDEEGSFIGPQDLASSIPPPPPHPKPNPNPQPQPNPSCPWHSASAIESLPDDDDASRSDIACACARGSVCVCVFCVSGPDGFVEAYAGAKRWRDGRETQGPVGGLLGRMMSKSGERESDCIVLKL
ncbi:hypothetical protein F4775DRAFT_563197 [Biscogniauxia sp. FL1348]|nr:hypothetical protein F4775DRAFT_563197 [Biscogniauxia sp. FL1348]